MKVKLLKRETPEGLYGGNDWRYWSELKKDLNGAACIVGNTFRDRYTKLLYVIEAVRVDAADQVTIHARLWDGRL